MKKTTKKKCFPYAAKTSGGRTFPANGGESGARSSCVVPTPRSVLGCLRLIMQWLNSIYDGVCLLIELLRPQISCYKDVVALVREIRYDSRLGIRSIPKAVDFVRFGVPVGSHYYERCINARKCVSELAKKRTDGVEKAWRSIAKMAQPNQLKKKKGKRGTAPRLFPIPDRSWVNGIPFPDGRDAWNNSFP